MVAAKPVGGEKYYVLLVDCGGDHQVKPRIYEQHEYLTRAGYTKIIGLRDVRPNFTYEQIPKLERDLKKYIKTSLIPVEFVLAVMEIEAWFLAEFNHFPKIDPLVTVSTIKATLGFDPESADLQLRDTPRDDLERSYMIGGKNYEKPAYTTIACLDYSYIYLELQHKVAYLKRLVASIDEFLI
ncbi:MAG: hypothetical protein ABI167_11545 [Nitrosospira sp.]